jgi:hypothetical protein
MRQVASVAALLLCFSGIVFAQAVATTEVKMAPLRTYTPKDADVYCAGFITDKPPIEGLFVVAGQEGGIIQMFSDRDTIYLSRGAGYIVNPGGEYILMRKLVDPSRVEIFEGQNKMLKDLGQVFAEVGRLKVNLIHQYVVTATITGVCSEIQAGDIAVPLNKRPKPEAPVGTFDRFAPATGKNEGVIAAAKEFSATLGAGDVAYLNIGAPQGVEVGQSYRIYRTYDTAARDPNRKYLENTPQMLAGMRQSYKLTKEQRAIMPRDIVGEMVILSVNGKSASGLITMASGEVFPGDQVEMK